MENSDDSEEEINGDEPMSPNQGSDKTIQKPKVGKIFSTIDELMCYYRSYAKQEGFGISKGTSTKKGAATSRYLTIMCNKVGMPLPRGKNIMKPRAVSKTNCNARLNVVATDSGGWRINSLELTHNHDLSPSKARFYSCHRKIDTPARRRLYLNDDASIRLNKSFNTFLVEGGGYENVPFLEKDARNYIQKRRQLQLQLQEGDAGAMRKYFAKMQANNPNFFYTMDLDEDLRLKNVFWADARSRAAYDEFGDIVTFDTTYRVDKYDMPFAPFVGVNHHG